jgi:hypothetical protein
MKHTLAYLAVTLLILLASACMLEEGREPQWLEDAPETAQQDTDVPAILPDYGKDNNTHSGDHSGGHR